ncbi:transporter [Chitinophaga costaii]|nr:transporter [Chitinophaga costaii]
MAVEQKVNPFLKINESTGFSNIADVHGNRFLNKDGTYNLRREGRKFWNRFSVYHALLNLSWPTFVLCLVAAYCCINLLYASLYLLIGISQLQGVVSHTAWGIFKEAFFFSTETFTTVGYGRVNPVGDGANLLAAIEAMSGFLSFAVATGLIYGRFSRPRAHLAFSEYAVIAPYDGGAALMFRFAGYKDEHTLCDVTVQVNMAMLAEVNGKKRYQYYELKLERNKVENLPMNWTVVHPIDNESPIQGLTAADLEAADVEIYVMIRGFNDVYSNFVLQRTSYTFDEIKFGRKFVPMYREDGSMTVLEMHKLSKSVEV